MNGCNQAIRDTWLKDTKEIPGLEYKFFLGGDLSVEENESFKQSWESREAIFREKILIDPDVSKIVLKEDEIILNAPDGYKYQTYKFREICHWALKHNYDYVFQILTDTFVVPDRLIASGFEKYDYIGTANAERTAIGGGPGIWLSSKTLQFLAESPVTLWYYDGWIGDVMSRNGIKLTHDPRYTNLGQDVPPRKDNDAITSHIANSPIVYDPQQMFELYEQARGI